MKITASLTPLVSTFIKTCVLYYTNSTKGDKNKKYIKKIHIKHDSSIPGVFPFIFTSRFPLFQHGNFHQTQYLFARRLEATLPRRETPSFKTNNNFRKFQTPADLSLHRVDAVLKKRLAGL